MGGEHRGNISEVCREPDPAAVRGYVPPEFRAGPPQLLTSSPPGELRMLHFIVDPEAEKNS